MCSSYFQQSNMFVCKIVRVVIENEKVVSTVIMSFKQFEFFKIKQQHYIINQVLKDVLPLNNTKKNNYLSNRLLYKNCKWI